MGIGHGICCMKCGFNDNLFLGVGMLYPEQSAEYRQEACQGRHGKMIQKLIDEHPEGMLDCANAIYKCSCGGWRLAPRGDYYIPEGDDELGEYFTREELEPCEDEEIDEDDEDFEPYTPPKAICLHKAKHLCPKCRRNMREVSVEEELELSCLRCGEKLEVFENDILWD